MRIMIALSLRTRQPLDYWLSQTDAVIVTALELLENDG